MAGVAAKLTWKQVLAWRMQRQLLEPIGTLSPEEVVRRLGAVQAQVASSAELAVRVRRRTSASGEVGRALADGRLIKTWAMRGTLHLLTPEDGGAFLSLIASGRSWERPSWQRYFGVAPTQIELLREAARAALTGAVLSREELIAALTEPRGFEHLGEALRSGWGTLLKPIAWHGDLCFGPSRGNRVTFTHPSSASDLWAGLPDPDEAAPTVIRAYLGAYGPATFDAFGQWLAGGYFGKRRLRTWFEGMGDELAEVDVEGERAWLVASHVDELTATKPSTAVRLLSGFDQYVLGPGTGDGHVVPPARRRAVSRQSGWISPVVVVGGAVCGTWEADGGEIRIGWFGEAGRPPRKALDGEVDRLAKIIGRQLKAEITVV